MKAGHTGDSVASSFAADLLFWEAAELCVFEGYGEPALLQSRLGCTREEAEELVDLLALRGVLDTARKDGRRQALLTMPGLRGMFGDETGLVPPKPSDLDAAPASGLFGADPLLGRAFEALKSAGCCTRYMFMSLFAISAQRATALVEHFRVMGVVEHDPDEGIWYLKGRKKSPPAALDQLERRRAG